MLMPYLVIDLTNSFGSRISCAAATTTVAPLINGRNNSGSAMSNETVVMANILSVGLQSTSCCNAKRIFDSEPWLISTPFGFPVVPEVYITHARSSG